MSDYQELIKLHGLVPHPEGGYFKETYRSEHSTGIFYLLTPKDKSKFHRIKSDEMWHFYSGDSLTVVEINEDGTLKETVLNHSNVQYVVPAGKWFGAYLPEGSKFGFVGCTVAPAFNFENFEMGDKQKLVASYPQAKVMIEKLML